DQGSIRRDRAVLRPAPREVACAAGEDHPRAYELCARASSARAHRGVDGCRITARCSTRPRSVAIPAACVREVAPNFDMIAVMCDLTVPVSISSSRAIALLEAPVIRRLNT